MKRFTFFAVTVLFCSGLFAPGALAQITNPSFETGDYTGWTPAPSADVWRNAPDTLATHFTAGVGADISPVPDGASFASSYWQIETGLAINTSGTLTSDPFTLSQRGIRFEAVGFPGNPVSLRRASDDSLIDEVSVISLSDPTVTLPGIATTVWQTFDLVAPSADLGTSVYIQVEFGGPFSRGDEWVAVDNFREVELNPVETLMTNPSFETGDYTGWTLTTSDTFLAAPVLYAEHPVIVAGFGLSPYTDGDYVASTSFLAPPPTVGALISDPFTLTGNVVLFDAAGNGNNANTIRLRNAADDAIIDEVVLPGPTTAWVELRLEAFEQQGESVYVEIECVGPGGADDNWISVDNFRETLELNINSSANWHLFN